MKKTFLGQMIAIVALAAVSLFASAQTYPVTSPTYTPNAIGAISTYTAPATYSMALQNMGTVSLRVSGTCTSLAGTVQASNDGTNYTAVNLYPIATGTTAPTAVASVGAVGFWKVNATGYTNLKLVISALTASCVVRMVGTSAPFNGTQF